MTALKEFVDFIYTLVNMDEVKDNKFPIPKEITFELSDDNHMNLQKEVHLQKTPGDPFVPENVFYVSIFGVEMKFIKKEDVSK